MYIINSHSFGIPLWWATAPWSLFKQRGFMLWYYPGHWSEECIKILEYENANKIIMSYFCVLYGTSPCSNSHISMLSDKSSKIKLSWFLGGVGLCGASVQWGIIRGVLPHADVLPVHLTTEFRGDEESWNLRYFFKGQSPTRHPRMATLGLSPASEWCWRSTSGFSRGDIWGEAPHFVWLCWQLEKLWVAAAPQWPRGGCAAPRKPQVREERTESPLETGLRSGLVPTTVSWHGFCY